MALVKWARDEYGMLERNRVQTHNVESQCELDTTAFPNGAEVGSIVAVDKAAGKIALTGGPLGLLANAEILADPCEQGLKNYHVKPGAMGVVIFPEVGNTWATNTITFDSGTFTNEATVVGAISNAATPVYGVQCSTTGEVELIDAATYANASGLRLRAIKNTTMPDGQKAVKFMVVNL